MSPSPYTIEDTRPIADAHVLMRQHQIRHLPVVHEDELVGMLSMRDLHLMETLKDIDPAAVLVAEVMTAEPYTVQVGTSLREVAINMNARKYGATIVQDKDAIVGLFTTVDAMRVLANLVE